MPFDVRYRQTRGLITFIEDNHGPANSIWQTQVPLLAIRCEPHLFCVYEHCFNTYSDGEQGWQDTLTGAATCAVQAPAAGFIGPYVRLGGDAGPGAGEDHYLSREDGDLIWTTGNYWAYEVLARLNDANTDDTNCIMGLSDSWADGSINSTGGDPNNTLGFMGFTKTEGETSWNLWSQENANVDQQAGIITRDALWHRFGMIYDLDGGLKFFYDGQQVGATQTDTTDRSVAAEMFLGFGIENSSANAGTIDVAEVRLVQLR